MKTNLKISLAAAAVLTSVVPNLALGARATDYYSIYWDGANSRALYNKNEGTTNELLAQEIEKRFDNGELEFPDTNEIQVNLQDSDGNPMSFNDYIFGGYQLTSSGSPLSANKNTIRLTFGTAKGIIGGLSAGVENAFCVLNPDTCVFLGTANDNLIEIAGTTDYAIGGIGLGSANNNSVTINGGTINKDVIGGMTAANKADAQAVGNTVIFFGEEVKGDIYGGVGVSVEASNMASMVTNGFDPSALTFVTTATGEQDFSKDNTLRLYSNKLKAKNIYNFSMLEFFLNVGIAQDDVVLTLSDTGKTDLSKSTVTAYLNNASNLNANSVVHLIQTAGTLTAPLNNDAEQTNVNIAGLLDAKGYVKLADDSQNLDLYFKDSGSTPPTPATWSSADQTFNITEPNKFTRIMTNGTNTQDEKFTISGDFDSGELVTITGAAESGVTTPGVATILDSYSDNTVNINLNSNSFNYTIFGGYATADEKVSGNTINVNSGQKISQIIGGLSKDGEISGNKVLINDSVKGTIKKVYGGLSENTGEVSGNKVIINGGEIESIWGGNSADKGNVIGNEVIIKDGKVTQFIVAGDSSGNGEVSNNTVTILGGDISGVDILAYDDSYNAANKNNTLNIGDSTTAITMDKLSAGNIYFFDNLNFYLPSDITNEAIALKLSDTGNTDLSKTTVTAYLSDASKLDADSVVHLIQTAGTLSTPKNNDAEQTNVNVSGLLNVKGYVKLTDNQNLDLYFKDSGSTPPTPGSWSSADQTFNITEPNEFTRIMTNGTNTQNQDFAITGNFDSKELKTIKGATLSNGADGTFTDSYSGNTVNIDLPDASVFNDGIFGGGDYDINEDVSGNTVNLNKGSVKWINGGTSGYGEVSGNKVFINGGTIYNVYGGWTSQTGKVSGNEIIIDGGTVIDSIYAGGSNSGEVSDNTVTLLKGDTSTAEIYGYYGTYGVNRNNTLNIGSSTTAITMDKLSARNIHFFDNLNFYLPRSASNEQVALSLTDDTGRTDLTNTKVSAYLSDATGITGKDDRIHLIKTAGSITGFDEANGQANLTNVDIAGLINVTGRIALDNTNQYLDLSFNGDPARWSSKDKIFNITEPNKFTRTMVDSNGKEVEQEFAITGEFGQGELVTITGALDSGATSPGATILDSYIDNTVNVDLKSNSFNNIIYGGISTTTENVSGNTVKLNTGTVKDIKGGVSGYGEASGNKVFINDGTVEYVYGGVSLGGKAIDNEVIINGGTVTNAIYAGYTPAGPNNVSDSTVTLLGGDTSAAEIHGAFNGTFTINKNNTLNIGTSTTNAKNLKAGNIINFDNLNFYSDLSAGEVALNLTGSNPTNLTKTAIKVNGKDDGYKAYITGNTGDKYYLLKSNEEIRVNDAWLKSTQSFGDTLNITSKTEYNVAQGGIFQSTDKKDLYIQSTTNATRAISSDGVFDGDEAGVANDITVNLKSADYDSLEIDLSNYSNIALNVTGSKNLNSIHTGKDSEVKVNGASGIGFIGAYDAKSLEISNSNQVGIGYNKDLELKDVTNMTLLDLQGTGNATILGTSSFQNASAFVNKLTFGKADEAMTMNTQSLYQLTANELEFYLPSDVKDGDTALEITDSSDTSLSGTKVSAYLSDATGLTNKNDKIHLIYTPNAKIADFDEANGKANLKNVDIAGLLNVTGKIALDSSSKYLDLSFNGDPVAPTTIWSSKDKIFNITAADKFTRTMVDDKGNEKEQEFGITSDFDSEELIIITDAANSDGTGGNTAVSDSGNTVNIGSNFNNDIYAGMTSSNTVNFSSGAVSGTISGGTLSQYNTLNIGTSTQTVAMDKLKAENIVNFENLNFYLDSSLNDGQTALTLTGTADTDLKNTTIKVNGSADGYKAYMDGKGNKYYLLKSGSEISVDSTWLSGTQTIGNVFNITSKTEYDVTQGGIFQSTDKKALYIASNSSITNAISSDGIFDDSETGVADGITVNLTNGADYGDLAINLTKQTTINLANAKNVGAINANNSDITITNSTLNGNTSANSLNLSGAINANYYIVANDDIVLNPNTNLTINDDLRSYYGDIHFSNAKANISGDIWANVVNFGDSSNAMSLGSITANDIIAQEINFYLPNSANYNSTALQLTTTGNTDLSSTKVSAFLSDASNLSENGAIHLIQTAGKLISPSTTDVSGVAVNVAGLINVKANIELDSAAQNLDLKFNGTPSGSGGGGSGGGGSGGATANEGAKTLLETKLSQNTVVNEGANLFVSNLGDIANSANNANSALSANGANSTNSNLDLGKAVTFAFVSGYDKEMTTGSHIDIKGFNANAGIAGNDYFNIGNLTTGLFVEYGKGEYDSFLDDGTKGSGKTEFIGGGAFARFTTLNNFYTEVSGRVGQVKTEYETTAAYKGFDISNTYYGAHLGLGKIFELTSSNDLDIFARGIWAKTAGNDIVLNGIQTHFDSVTSLRAQVGFKDNFKFSDTSKLYVGATYQYEFDGESKGTLSVPAINAVADIASPKLKGSTGIGEIGYVYENSSIKFEVGAKGYVGKEKGYSGNLGVTIKF